MTVTLFDGDWRNCAGEILAAWFIANPNGPTASAVGLMELGSKRVMFYRWMHFTGGRTWLASELNEEIKSWDGEFGGILVNTLLKLNNHFLMNGGETVFLKYIPNVILTNQNPQVASSFFEFTKLSTIEEDWGRQVYFCEKYGANFFDRFEEEYRDIYERLKGDPDGDRNYLELFLAEHSLRKGFQSWKPNQYTSSTQTEDLYRRWYRVVTDEEYALHGLYEIAQMWVGACFKQRDTGLLDNLRKENRLETLDDMLAFFNNMNMPLLPEKFTEQSVAESMRLKY